MKKIISILSLSLIVSFTSLYAEVDGYKDLKFSLNKNEARMILDKYCDTNIVNENFKDTKCNKLMGETTKITTSYNNKTGLLQVITLLRTPISPEDIKILVKALDKKYKFIGAKPYKKSKMLHAFGNYQVLLMENVKDTRLIYVNKEVSTFFKDMLSYGEVRKVEEDDI